MSSTSRFSLRSFAIALLTTLACIVIAYPLAWLIARSPKKRRDLLVLLVILPFASNFLVRIYAWIMLLGPLGLLYTPTARDRRHGLCASALHGAAPVHQPGKARPGPAGSGSGSRRHAWTRFWRITFPLSLPGLFSGSALVFIPVLGMFAVPELLGGTGDILIGNLIKEQFLDNRDWPLGSALSIVLTIAVLLLAGLASWGARRGLHGTEAVS